MIRNYGPYKVISLGETSTTLRKATGKDRTTETTVPLEQIVRIPIHSRETALARPNYLKNLRGENTKKSNNKFTNAFVRLQPNFVDLLEDGEIMDMTIHEQGHFGQQPFGMGFQQPKRSETLIIHDIYSEDIVMQMSGMKKVMEWDHSANLNFEEYVKFSKNLRPNNQSPSKTTELNKLNNFITTKLFRAHRIEKVFIWTGHAKLQEKEFSANDWFQTYSKLLSLLNHQMPGRKQIQLTPLPNWKSIVNNDCHFMKKKYDDILTGLRGLSKSNRQFTFLEVGSQSIALSSACGQIPTTYLMLPVFQQKMGSKQSQIY